jgi:hypothetical protein
VNLQNVRCNDKNNTNGSLNPFSRQSDFESCSHWIILEHSRCDIWVFLVFSSRHHLLYYPPVMFCKPISLSIKKDKFQVCSGFISSIMKVYRFEELMVICQRGSCDTCKMVIWRRVLLPAIPLNASSLNEIAECLKSFNKQISSKDM